jgi:enamine deaminase RidA (YjgF/YER057c/UK114 family)
VIGVGGVDNPFSGEAAPLEGPESFGVQLHNCFDRLKSHLRRAGRDVPDFVRLDTAIRNVNRADECRDHIKQRCGGTVPFASYVVGDTVAKRTQQEIGGVAVNTGVVKEIAWDRAKPDAAQAVRAGGLVFASGCSGLEDVATGQVRHELYGDKVGQARQALRRLEAALLRFDSGLDKLLRLDVFLDDIYFEDEFYCVASEVLGKDGPAISVVGVQLANNAEVEVSAIAAA